MTTGYVIRELAQKDLEDIWLYTFNKWGAVQADNYLRQLLSRFNWLAENPLSGRQRDEVKPGYFSFPEGMHVIFYTVTDHRTEIIGIPHQIMDIISYFDNAD